MYTPVFVLTLPNGRKVGLLLIVTGFPSNLPRCEPLLACFHGVSEV